MRYKIAVFKDGTAQILKRYRLWPFWLPVEIDYNIRMENRDDYERVDENERWNSTVLAERALRAQIKMNDAVVNSRTVVIEIPVDIVRTKPSEVLL